MAHLSWEDLSPRLRERVTMRLGEIFSAESAPCGAGSDLTTILRTTTGPVFLKGIRLDSPRADVRRIEQKVQKHLPDLAPPLLWQTDTDGWLLLIFEHVNGRHANLTSGSADLPLIAKMLRDLSQTFRPNLPVLPIERRWAPFTNGFSLALLRGTTLVHTDLTAENILIGDRVRVVDWAWPTLGAAWLDTAFVVARLIQAGHTPAEAEAWAGQIPAWGSATDEAITTFIDARIALARTRAHEPLGEALSIWKEHRHRSRV